MAKELDLIKILSQKNQEDYGNISIHRMGDNRLMIRKNTHGSKPIIINRHIYVITRKGRNLFKEDKDIVFLRLAYLRHKI